MLKKFDIEDRVLIETLFVRALIMLAVISVDLILLLKFK
jgi:hypothetical protein